MEEAARILHSSTPKFAKSISSKYSLMSTRDVVLDLSENHGRSISRDYVQVLSNRLGEQIVEAESRWRYEIPRAVLAQTHTISIGRDGTTAHIRGEGYRETMNGTISFYNGEKERIHSIYRAQAPEYGKSVFNQRFSQRIEEIKDSFQSAGLTTGAVTYIGLADGAKDNWTFLDAHTQVSILDFWHACEYLTLASKMISTSKYLQKQWLIKARKRLKEEDGAAQKLLDQMRGLSKKRGFSGTTKEGLQKAVTYFENHAHQMDYPRYQNENCPIGSGVTEAACKVIVKQRLCCSGMSWKIPSAQNVLNIRTLKYSKGEWEQFWNNIDKYGFYDN